MNVKELKRLIREEVSLMLEGGKVFSGRNSFVPKETIAPILKWVMKKTKLSGLKYTIIGNIHKSVSGDIDILFNSEDLYKKVRATDLSDFWTKIDKYLSKMGVDYAINKGFREIHILAPLINTSGKQLPAVIDRKGNVDSKKTAGYVQVDIMLGDDQFSPDYYSTASDTKYKAVHRNMLLASIFSVLKFKAKGGTKHKFQISAQGMELINFVVKNGKRTKLSSKLVSTDMNKIAKFLFGKNASFSDIESIEKFWKLFMSSRLKFPDIRNDAKRDYISSLSRAKLEIPSFVK